MINNYPKFGSAKLGLFDGRMAMKQVFKKAIFTHHLPCWL